MSEYPDSIEGMRERGQDMTDKRKARQEEIGEQTRKKRNKILAGIGIAAATLGTALAIRSNKAVEGTNSLPNERKTPEKTAPAIPGEVSAEEEQAEAVAAMEQRDQKEKAEEFLKEEAERDEAEKTKYREIINNGKE